MKSLLTFVALAIVAGSAAAQTGNRGAKVGKAGFVVNVSAYEQCPAGEFTNSNRHMIAVQADFTGVATENAESINKIYLRAGDDFRVEDGNACDRTGAYFTLPVTEANCVNCDGPRPTYTEYAVRARLVGKPNGRATVTGCTVTTSLDPLTGLNAPASLCSVGQRNVWVGTRTPGAQAQNVWQNATTELLTVCVDTTGDGVCDDRIGLFDSSGENYWWSFDNARRPHVQLVFLPVASGGDGGDGGGGSDTSK